MIYVFWGAFVGEVVLTFRIFATHGRIGSVMLVATVILLALVGAGASVAFQIVIAILDTADRSPDRLNASVQSTIRRAGTTVGSALIFAAIIAAAVLVFAMNGPGGLFEPYG